MGLASLLLATVFPRALDANTTSSQTSSVHLATSMKKAQYHLALHIPSRAAHSNHRQWPRPRQVPQRNWKMEKYHRAQRCESVAIEAKKGKRKDQEAAPDV